MTSDMALTPQAEAALVECSLLLELPRATVLSRAVVVYGLLEKARSQGAVVIVAEPDGTVQEMIWS